MVEISRNQPSGGIELLISLICLHDREAVEKMLEVVEGNRGGRRQHTFDGGVGDLCHGVLAVWTKERGSVVR